MRTSLASKLLRRCSFSDVVRSTARGFGVVERATGRTMLSVGAGPRLRTAPTPNHAPRPAPAACPTIQSGNLPCLRRLFTARPGLRPPPAAGSGLTPTDDWPGVIAPGLSCVALLRRSASRADACRHAVAFADYDAVPLHRVFNRKVRPAPSLCTDRRDGRAPDGSAYLEGCNWAAPRS
jgi:hypothetical protein